MDTKNPCMKHSNKMAFYCDDCFADRDTVINKLKRNIRGLKFIIVSDVPEGRMLLNCNKAVAERDATIAELCEALKPFADEADIFHEATSDDLELNLEDDSTNLCFGDLRKAKAALSKLGRKL